MTYLDPRSRVPNSRLTLNDHERKTIEEAVQAEKPFGWSRAEANESRNAVLRSLEEDFNASARTGNNTIDRLMESGNLTMKAAEYIYQTPNNMVPTIEDHLECQDQHPLPIFRSEVMLSTGKTDKMSVRKQEKALELMGVFLMGTFKINHDMRQNNRQTGKEKQRDNIALNLSLLNLGNLNRDPWMAGTAKFCSEVTKKLNMRPLGNLIFQNPSHIVLACESAFLKENYADLAEFHQCIGLRAAHTHTHTWTCSHCLFSTRIQRNGSHD